MLHASFFVKDHKRIGAPALNGFFKKFSGRRIAYHVAVGVSDEFGAFLAKLGFEVSPMIKLSPQVAVATAESGKFSVAVVETVQAFDSFGAMSDLFQTLTSVRSLTYLALQGMSAEWSQAAYVSKPRSSAGDVVRRRSVSFFRSTAEGPTSGGRLRQIVRYSKRILSSFDEASTERLFSSLNTAALARTSPNRENQLISLWSAIEVLLSEPSRDRDGSRIAHYSRLLVPCICLNHVRRQFVSVYDDMTLSYRRRFMRIVDSVPSNDDPHTRFAAVLLLDEHEEVRSEFVKLSTDNPLALHRLWKLRRDYCNSGDASRTIAQHQQRVMWQISRIYRARNELVHAGSTPTYLDSLILNLAEYYRGTIATLLKVSRRDNVESDIDQVVSEAGLYFQIHRAHFATSRRVIERSDLRILLG